MSSSSSTWSLEAFCDGQHSEDWSALPPSAEQFLQRLDLPSMHPFCSKPTDTLIYPSAPDMGPPTEPYATNSLDSLVTLYFYYVLPTVALIQIWAILLAGYLAPLGLGCLIWHQQRRENSVMAALTLFFSWLVMTDDQYVLEFGRLYGIFLLSGTLLVSRPKRFLRLLCLFLVFDFISPWSFEDPEEVPVIEPGLYYNPRNEAVDQIVHAWQATVPDYSEVSTPWQLTGDARTGLPYLMNSVDDYPKFHRVWLPTEDDEFVALDIAFPESGHAPDQPLYLILHGLNGGSAEGYVIDLTASRIREGSTVVVMVARGLMDTPIQGWTFFHGARITDAHSAASTLRERVLQPNQILAGVGYSLGAIVLNHYVSKYEDDVALDVSVSISGALYSLYQMDYVRSKHTWQRMIAAHMKDMFMSGKWGERLYRRLGQQDYQQLLRAKNVIEIDHYAGEMYHGFDNLNHFYTEMSAILPNNATHNHVAIPHLVLQAFDDPISTWRSIVVNDPTSPLYPWNLVNEDQDNLVLLLTKKGGHVGWPIGWWPHSWKYMNEYVAAGFIDAFHDSKRSAHHSLERNKKRPSTRKKTRTTEEASVRTECPNAGHHWLFERLFRTSYFDYSTRKGLANLN